MTTEPSHAAPYVFLSYASADRERALHIADLLESHGISVWIDRKSIAGGTSWSAEIVPGIHECVVLIVACTPAAVVSPNVHQEIQLAWETCRPILPLLLQAIELPDSIRYALAGRQRVEVLDHPDDVWLPQALRALTGLGITPRAATIMTSAPLAASVAQETLANHVEIAHPRPHLLASLTSFVGREREIADVQRLFGLTRLLTVTGPGGCGKTRLAFQFAASLADNYPDGTCAVELGPVADAALILQTVAAALGLRDDTGQPVLTTLLNFLSPKQLVIILDNCEHVIDAAARLADTILQACPNVRILATSREALGVTGEVVYWVPSLSTPPTDGELPPGRLLEYAAGRLFVERATAVLPDFAVTARNAPVVAQLCRRLDGMPLAIELAAERIRAMTVEQIVARLDDRFGLLTTGSRTAHPRHQTLRRTIDWSYDLLSEDEQTLFDRLGVFAGGWMLEAVDAVGGASRSNTFDLLARLVDRSLVIAEPRGAVVRYRLLETLRQYAHERLAQRGEIESIGDRHARYFLTLTEEIEPRLERSDLGMWLDHLEQEHDNLRAAISWLRDRGAVEEGLRLTSRLRLFWHLRGHFTEGREWIAQLLSLDRPIAPSVRAQALDTAGFLARFQGDYPAARVLIRDGLAIRRTIGDQQQIADSLSNLGSVHLFEGDYPEARALYEESLQTNRELGNQQGIADGLSHLGKIALSTGDVDGARSMHAESLEIWRRLGDQQGIGWALFKLADIELHQGRLVAARPLVNESLMIRSEIGHTWGIIEALGGIAAIAAGEGQLERALTLGGAAAALAEASGIVGGRLREAELDRWLQPARQALEKDRAAVAWATGRAMTVDEATHYGFAVGEPRGSPTERTTSSVSPARVNVLTRREREVVALITRGLTNREIATQLVISERTAERHVENILGRLGLRSRAQIAVWGVEHEIVSPS